MEYLIHKVIKEEKIADIAEKYKISVNEIKEANPNATFFKALFGAEFVASLQDIKIPQKKTVVKVESEDEKFLNELNFEKIARYRCTQINLTKVADNVTFSSEIKTQYLLSTVKNQIKYFHIKLEDYVYALHPKEIEIAFQITEPIEFLRNNLKFTQNENAEIIDILNINQLKQDWQTFKQVKLPKIDFFQKLKEQNPKATEDIIRTGDKEFSNVSVLKNIIDKNLFYHILLKANIGEDLKDFIANQPSQIFPNQNLCINVVKSKVSEDESTTVFRLVGTLQRENISIDSLRKQYNEIYKPLIKFSFTEFDYIYRITYTLDTKTGLLIDANASLSEKVKNNYEYITQFQIKKVEL